MSDCFHNHVQYFLEYNLFCSYLYNYNYFFMINDEVVVNESNVSVDYPSILHLYLTMKKFKNR